MEVRIEKGEDDILMVKKTVYLNVEERSVMAQEIISRKPAFIEQWALFIYLGILFLLFAASWFIKYPDIIQARAVLAATDGPKEIITRHDGRLVKLFVRNSQPVKLNDELAWLESTSSHEEVLDLSMQLDRCINLLNDGRSEAAALSFKRRYNNLGEIQQAYQNFITALQQFNDYAVNGFYYRKERLLSRDTQSLKQLRSTIESQLIVAQRDAKLAEESYQMNSKLYNDKVLSAEDIRKEESKLLSRKIPISQFVASLLNNETQLRDKLKELEQLHHDVAQEQLIFRQALQTVKSSVDEWKKKYVVLSPIDGKIFFVIPLQENQFLQQGKLLAYIKPDSSHFYIETYLPQENFGKIAIGLQAQLRFDAYPYQETGFVQGRLDYVSAVPSDSGFFATIKLDNGLITNNNKPIASKSGLKVQAIIITKNMRLTDRIFSCIVKATSTGK